MGEIGAILRCGSQEEQDSLLSTLAVFSGQHCLQEDHTQITTTNEPQPAACEESSSERSNSTSQVPLDGNSSSDESEAEIWRYTSTLGERAAGLGKVVNYNETMICSYPANFRIVAIFQGREVAGEGPNKKLAKHRASKSMCELLNIRL